LFACVVVVARADVLIDAPGVELVRGHCSACHSLAVVAAQRGDQEFWRETIVWMQKTQNLWAIPQSHEQAILEYLAAHYGASQFSRRPHLAAELMPLKQ
jgi:hypothetical protein